MDREFEPLESARLNVELPFQVRTHLVFYLVDVKGALTPADDIPGPIKIGLATGVLRNDHERGDGEAVARFSISARGVFVGSRC